MPCPNRSVASTTQFARSLNGRPKIRYAPIGVRSIRTLQVAPVVFHVVRVSCRPAPKLRRATGDGRLIGVSRLTEQVGRAERENQRELREGKTRVEPARHGRRPRTRTCESPGRSMQGRLDACASPIPHFQIPGGRSMSGVRALASTRSFAVLPRALST